MPDFKEANFHFRQFSIRGRVSEYVQLQVPSAVSPKRFEIHKRLIRYHTPVEHIHDKSRLMLDRKILVQRTTTRYGDGDKKEEKREI